MFKKNSSSTIILTLMLLLSSVSCSNDKNTQEYLKKVLRKLDKIESAIYFTKSEGWAPWDTAAYGIYHHLVKEYSNPDDTAIGASFVKLWKDDTSRLSFCYDGMMRASVYDENKTIVVDSFKVRKLPFRPINAPFFNYTTSILKYAIQTKDSIKLEIEELKNDIYVTLTIFEDKQVEFFGKAFYMPSTEYNYGETTSKYEIWINKSNDLPYKVRREMSHDISVRTCYDVVLNKNQLKDFNAADYFQPDYEIVRYGFGKPDDTKNNLIGKKAPDWMLNNAEGRTVALSELKSKVVMIQFTSVSCGPCRASIPFLKQLCSEYSSQDFNLIAIEGFNHNSNVLLHYKQINKFDYEFLVSNNELTNSYNVTSVPVFFILDNNHIIRKIIRGYSLGTTDQEVKDIINMMI